MFQMDDNVHGSSWEVGKIIDQYKLWIRWPRSWIMDGCIEQLTTEEYARKEIEETLEDGGTACIKHQKSTTLTLNLN